MCHCPYRSQCTVSVAGSAHCSATCLRTGRTACGSIRAARQLRNAGHREASEKKRSSRSRVVNKNNRSQRNEKNHANTRDADACGRCLCAGGGDDGYTVTERNFTVDELLQLVSSHEAALSGTAATLSPVGHLVYNGDQITVRDGNPGPNTEKLRAALQAVQSGTAPDTHGWLTEV